VLSFGLAQKPAKKSLVLTAITGGYSPRDNQEYPSITAQIIPPRTLHINNIISAVLMFFSALHLTFRSTFAAGHARTHE
jgi:hypothetical protein